MALLRDVYLAADHRMDAPRLGVVVELHRAEQIAVIGHSHGGHLLLDRQIHQLRNFASAVEQRIIGVAMQMNKRRGHGRSNPGGDYQYSPRRMRRGAVWYRDYSGAASGLRRRGSNSKGVGSPHVRFEKAECSGLSKTFISAGMMTEGTKSPRLVICVAQDWPALRVELASLRSPRKSVTSRYSASAPTTS